MIGDLVAKLSIDEGRGITLRWLLGHGKNERWLTVAQAKRSVGESWINVAWESPTPGEWLTRASSRFWEPRMSPGSSGHRTVDDCGAPRIDLEPDIRSSR